MINNAKKVHIYSVILVVVGSEEQNNLDTYIHSEFHYTDKSKSKVF